jgi:hypothetical protein
MPALPMQALHNPYPDATRGALRKQGNKRTAITGQQQDNNKTKAKKQQ